MSESAGLAGEFSSDLARERSDVDVRALDSVLSPGDVVMLVSSGTGGALTSRPVTCVEVDETRCRCLVDRTADWARPMAELSTSVNVAFTDRGANTYVSMSGFGTIDPSPDEVRRLWNPAASAFFDGPEDSRAAVLTVTLRTGQWWSGTSGLIGRAISLVKAVVSDDPENAGEHGSLAGRRGDQPGPKPVEADRLRRRTSPLS